MECNYEPYIQITGTTSFPPLRSRPFIRNCELESLFQQEKCNDRLSRGPGRRYFKENDTRQNATGGSRSGGGGGGGYASNEDATRAFHERYSYLTPKAFCLSGPDGSKSLCLNQREYEAIVERSRNKNSDCVVLCPVSTDDQDLDDEVCSGRTPSSPAECRCRRKRNRPTSPVCKPDPCSGRSGKRGRANAACATKAALVRMKNDKKNCSNCPRGSCGRPMKCSSQTYNKIPRSKPKPCNGRLPPVENSCHRSKINQPSRGCCCTDVCPKMTSGCAASSSKRLTDSCRPTAADSARIRPKGGCCAETSSGRQTNWDNLLPPICGSDSRRTRLRSINLEACDGGKPVSGYNVYDCAKIDSTCSNRFTADEKTFNLSAM